MAKKKTTKKDEMLFKLEDVTKQAPDQTTQHDKEKVILSTPEEPKNPTKKKAVQKSKNKPKATTKEPKPKKKAGRPIDPNKLEYTKYTLRIPTEWVKELKDKLERDKLTGQPESYNTFFMRSIRNEIDKKK